VKHILEYEDHDIQDLLGDLEGIGQAKTYRGALWVSFNVFKSSGRLIHDVDFCYLMTEPIFGTGDESRDKGLALKKIQEGGWSRPPFDREEKVFGLGYPGIVKILSPKSLTDLSKGFTDLDAFSLQVGKDLEEAQEIYISKGEIYKAGYLDTREARKVRTFGFVAPEGEDCLTSGYTGYHSGGSMDLDPLSGIYYIK
jgi:hypothetical protein